MARPSPSYEPRQPARSVLYQVVRDHFETFRAQAAGVCHGGGLPRFIEEEFEGFLRCGFLAGGFALSARDRARLERICRYALRPPVADDRIRLTGTGQVLLELRRRWTDGTTHLVFDPPELLERLAALTPRPRINLVLYYGVLGAHAAWRSRLGSPEAVAPGRDTGTDPSSRPERAGLGTTEPCAGPISSPRSGSNMLWAQLMQRSFGFDVLACSRCGGRLRLIALIEDPSVIRRILRHLGRPTEVPAARPSRAPPIPFELIQNPLDDDIAVP